jgi:hypothetical protein
MTTAPRPKGKIIVFGILFYYPLAGVNYQFLHYLLGLRRLGYDPYYVEDSGRWVYDPTINDLTPDASRNIAAVLPMLVEHGFADRWAFRGDYPDGQCYGMTEQQIFELYREADAFLNVTGAQEIREEHLRCKRRIYVESDPFVAQVQVAQGNKSVIAALSAHDTLFSFGENLGNPDCAVPMDPRFRWLPTRQPVAVDLWESEAPCGDAYNTITTWSNRNKDIEYNGEKYYWTKDREFKKYLDLPLRRDVPFELAVGVNDEVDRLLREKGWRRTDSMHVSRNPACYRKYIQQSRGEFTVARDQYTRPKTGWFSDRSVCYLAAGRPVITEETGFSKFLPSGEGLFGFSSMDDILRAIDTIESDYEGNCRAAREIAHEHLAAEKVVGDLISRAGLA